MAISLRSPRVLYFTRVAQLITLLAFLILVCYSGVHRGWWNNINGALAVGVITAIFTLVLTLHTIITTHLNRNPFSDGSTIITAVRIAAEVIVFLLWIATATLMLRHKGGCGYDGGDRDTVDGIDTCFSDPSGKNYKLWSDQPVVQWDVGVALTFVEIVSFFLSIFLVFKEERGSKVSGEMTSYA